MLKTLHDMLYKSSYQFFIYLSFLDNNTFCLTQWDPFYLTASPVSFAGWQYALPHSKPYDIYIIFYLCKFHWILNTAGQLTNFLACCEVTSDIQINKNLNQSNIKKPVYIHKWQNKVLQRIKTQVIAIQLQPK